MKKWLGGENIGFNDEVVAETYAYFGLGVEEIEFLKSGYKKQKKVGLCVMN